MSLEHFFNMGGYAFYVWTSYGLTLGILALNLALPLRRQARTRDQVRSWIRQQERKRS